MPPNDGEALIKAVPTDATELDLSRKGLTSLSPAIGSLKALSKLDLSVNQLHDLPDELENLNYLHTLTLARNRFKHVPAVLDKLSNLLVLILNQNEFDEFPTRPVHFTNLSYLDLSDNHLFKFTPELFDARRLTTLNLERNRLTDLPLSIISMTPSLGPTAPRPLLEIDGNPIAHKLLSGATRNKQPDATRQIFARLMGRNETHAPEVTTSLASIPSLPSQGAGPHFEIRDDGVVDFVPPDDLDAEGNDVATLQNLQPMLQELVKELLTGLSGGNSPHFELCNRLTEYQRQISLPLNEINFAVLFGLGLRCTNALRAAELAVPTGDLPPLGPAAQERIHTFQQLHGVFVSATSAGSALLAAEIRFSRSPAQEREYRTAAVEFAKELAQHPEVVAPAAAEFIGDVAQEIGQGEIPERSGTVATGTIRNASVAIASAALIAALPIGGGLLLGPGGAIGGGALALLASEALKKSKTFKPVRDAMAHGIDTVPNVDIVMVQQTFRPHFEFMNQIRERFTALASKDEGLRWLRETTDWLFRRSKQSASALAVDMARVGITSETISDLKVLIQEDVSPSVLAEKIRDSFPNTRIHGTEKAPEISLIVTFPSGGRIGIRRRKRGETGYDVALFWLENDTMVEEIK